MIRFIEFKIHVMNDDTIRVVHFFVLFCIWTNFFFKYIFRNFGLWLEPADNFYNLIDCVKTS